MLRFLYYGVIVRTLLIIVLGLNVRHRDRLPNRGPAVLIANHNSHLDAMVLMSLLPRKLINRTRPVAAADYFLGKGRLFAWFARDVVGILPIKRGGGKDGDPLSGCTKQLEAGNLLIFFPEGTRGEPEQMSEIKKGIAYLAERHPQVPVIPVFLHGLGKALPKGEGLLVPFHADVFVGEPLRWNGNRDAYLESVRSALDELSHELEPKVWE